MDENVKKRLNRQQMEISCLFGMIVCHLLSPIFDSIF